MNIKWNELKIIRNNETVILSNVLTRKWIEIDKESFEFLLLNYCYEKTIFISEYSKHFNENIKESIKFFNKLNEYGIIYSDLDNQKRIASLYITDKCNLNCKYCYRASTFENKGFVDIKTISLMFEKLAIFFNCDTIVLTGGEPLLHPNIFEILKMASDFFPNVILQTNGTLINDDNIQYIKKYINRVRIGLDGSSPESNDVIRGRGTFEKIMFGIDLICQYDIPLTISTTMYDTNIQDIERLNELAKSKKAEIVFTEFMPLGRGIGHSEKYMELNKKHNANTTSDVKCGAFTRKLSVDHNGYIYPCDELMCEDFLVGSIFKINRENMYDNENIRKLISRTIYTLPKCIECKFNYICNALCPAKVYRECGSICQTESNCQDLFSPLK